MKNKHLKKLICIILVIASLLSIGLVPASADNTAGEYSDVNTGNWFYSAVVEAGNYGIMGGYGNGKFGPNDKLTREQFVKILASVAEIDIEPYKSYPINRVFSDVPAESWYAPYVAWAYENKITSGVSAGKFGTGNQVTREQVAKFIITFTEILRYTLDKTDDAIVYSDMDSVSSWAVESVSAISNTGLFKGDDQKRYNPTSGITRAETATVMVRLIKQIDANAADDNYILGIKADKTTGTASVRAFASVNARVELQILSEDKSTILATKTGYVRTVFGPEEVSFSFPTAVFPDYFVLCATLYDRNGNMLCDTFTTIHYTKAYEEFSSKTVYDFPEDRVINLDENINDNYIVASDSTVILQDGNNITIVSESDDKTSFTLKGAAASSLSAGDKAIIETASGAYPVLIESIDNKNGSYIVKCTPGDKMEDYFSTIRISVDTLGQSENEARLMSDDIDTDIYISKSLPIPLGSIESKFKLGAVEVGGSFSGTECLSLEVIWDIVLFGKDYIYFELIDELSYETSMDIAVKGEGDIDIFKFVGMGTDCFPEKIRKYVNLKFEVVAGIFIEAKGSASVDCDGTITVGFIYQTGCGTQKIKTVKNTATTSLKAEAEIRIGPKATMTCKIGDIVDASMEFFSGAVVEAKAAENLGGNSNADNYHACELCLEGNLSAQMTLKINFEAFGKSEIEVKGEAYNESLMEFYASVINEAESVHKGKFTFGKGDCPNYVYKTKFAAEDSDGKTSDALISAPDKNGGTVLLSSGESVYLYPGSYGASAVIDDEEVKVSFKVTKSSQSVTLKPERVNLLVRVADDKGSAIPGASLSVSGDVIYVGIVEENGVQYEKYRAKPGKVTISASAQDYTSETKEYTVNNSMRETIVLQKNDWLEEYIKLLKSKKSGSFLLAYIDDDDIPELLYTLGDFHAVSSELYIYKDGSMIGYDGISDFGDLYFIEKTGRIYADNWINGYGEKNSIFNIAEDGTLKTEKTFEASDLNKIYKIDGVSYSKSAYQAESAKWLKNQGWIYFGCYTNSFNYSSKNMNSVLNKLRADYTQFLYKG